MKKRAIVIMLVSLVILIPVMAYASSAEVVIDETILEPKDPILATVVAIGPGLLVHGFGHYFTEDYKMGLLLTGIEIMSLGIMTFGAIENVDPELFRVYGAAQSQARVTGAWVFGLGVFAFIGSWLVDVMLVGDSARQYNLEHNLEFKIQEESMGSGTQLALMYNHSF